MYMVKSVGVWSVAKIAGLIYGCLGLMFAPFFLLLGLLGAFAGEGKSPFAGVFGVAVAIIMPVAYGGMGLIMGAIGGMLYNIFAKITGGVELDLEMRPMGLAAPYPIVPPATLGI